MRKFLYIAFGIVIGFCFLWSFGVAHAALSILKPLQGGTGIGTSTPADVGKCIKVLSDNPFTYSLDTCGSGSVSSGDSAWSILSGNSLIPATSTFGIVIRASSTIGNNASSSALTLLGISTSSVDSNSAAATSSNLIIYDQSNSNAWSTTNPWGLLTWRSADAGVPNKNLAGLGLIAEAATGGNTSMNLFTASGSGDLIPRMTIGSGGNVGIASSTPAFPFGIHGLTRPWWVTTAGQLFIGGNDGGVFTSSMNQADIKIASNNASFGAGIFLTNFANSANGPVLHFGKSHSGTVGSFSPALSGDSLGTVAFTADDGDSGFIRAAAISAAAEQDATSSVGYARIVFSTANGASVPTERMRISSGGSLGLGDTTPDNILSISTSSASVYSTVTTGTTLSGGGSMVIVENTANTATGSYSGIEFRVANGSGNLQRGFIVTPSTDVTNSGALAFGTRNAGNMVERMRLLNSGNLGLGTTSPSAQLTIDGGSSGALRNLFLISSSTPTATTTLLSVDSSGNITGAGTATFGTGGAGINLTVNGGTLRVLRSAIGDGGINLPGGGVVSLTSTGQLSFHSSSTENARFVGGRFAIGTTSPFGIFDVSSSSASTDLVTFDTSRSISVINRDTTAGNAQGIVLRSVSNNGITQSGVKLLGVNTARSAAGLTTDFAILTNNDGTISEKMRVLSNGRVGIGTTSPFAKLSVHGDPNDTTSVLFAVSSSTLTSTTTLFSISTSGTTTASNGFNITSGCFAVNGVCVTGGSGSPGGSTQQLQFNDGGTFGGAANVVWNKIGGFLGIGSTSPSSLLAVASTTWSTFNAPIFSVATSSDTLGTLFTVSATTSSLFSTGWSGDYDGGFRIFAGPGEMPNRSLYQRDHFLFDGRMSSGSWTSYECLLSEISVSADSTNGAGPCPGYTFQVDTTGRIDPRATAGLLWSTICTNGSNPCNTGATAGGSGAMLAFLSVSNLLPIVTASTTPVIDTYARISDPQNASSSRFMIGFHNVSNIGTGFETEPTAGCYFVASSTLANWQAECRTSVANTTTQDTGFASTTLGTATGQFLHFRIEADNYGTRFLMASATAPILTQVAYITTNVPTSTALNVSLMAVKIGSTGGSGFGIDFMRWKLFIRQFVPF